MKKAICKIIGIYCRDQEREIQKEKSKITRESKDTTRQIKRLNIMLEKGTTTDIARAIGMVNGNKK